jgi:hypothetical protein
MHKIDASLLGKVPLSYFLGTLGMPGALRRVVVAAGDRPPRAHTQLLPCLLHSDSQRQRVLRSTPCNGKLLTTALARTHTPHTHTHT